MRIGNEMKIELTSPEIEAVVALRANESLSEAALASLEQLVLSPKRLAALEALLDERERLKRGPEEASPEPPAPRPKRGAVPPAKPRAPAARAPTRDLPAPSERPAAPPSSSRPSRPVPAKPHAPHPVASEPALRREPLSEEKILQAAHIFMERRNLIPFASTPGPVPGLPGETWRSIDDAGRLGERGLKKGRTLKEILAPLWR